MIKSKIFYTNKYKEIQNAIKNLLNSQPDFLSKQTAFSTRAAGDAIQEILSDNFRPLLGSYCKDYSAKFARRAMADLAFTDTDGIYYVVDVKTQRADTKFNMPNLTSVERLARFYEDDSNYFVLLMVKYSIDDTKVHISQVYFVPIEFLGWDCLTIGALGWGQVQIADAKVITVNEGYSRKKWMIQLCDIMFEFYPKEIEKINHRIDYFKKVKEFWQNKPEM